MTTLKRCALVIGNSEYENGFQRLANAENDQEKVGEKLKSLGFDVTIKPNQTRIELLLSIEKFAKQTDESLSDIVFYYSGHGCSISGKNYLIPVDGVSSSESSFAKESYTKLETLISILVKYRRIEEAPIIIILDCCRCEIIEGLEHGNLIKDEGTFANIFIMYATGSNQTASDGEDNNGAFTKFLLKYMDTDKDIENISKNILIDLRNHSRHENGQISWTGSSLFKPYSFRTASQKNLKINNQLTLQQESVFWPKYEQNSHFVDRPDVFEAIDLAIKNRKECKPVILCGLGGMGKSQIAIEFCYRNKDNYRYIFWMEADTEETLQASFLNTAKLLKLIVVNTTEAKDIVIQWLQNNNEWLLVFDNADDYSLGSTESRRLQNNYFPKRGKGTIFMTTRNASGQQDGSVINLDIMKMDDEAAISLLLRENANLVMDKDNALKIVQNLGYLPLAIDIAGSYMRTEGLTPTEYIVQYNKGPVHHLDLDFRDGAESAYKKTISTVWVVSFNHIKRKNALAAKLLRCIALLYPDDIPLTVFKSNVENSTLPKIVFDDKNNSLSVILKLLGDFSLVRKTIRWGCDAGDPTKITLTVHRLVQAVILQEIELPEKLEWCERLIYILSREVPSDSQLYNEHSRKIMEAYVPHIRHVLTQFSQLTDKPCTIPKELIALLSPTVTYLTRQGLFEGVEYLAKFYVSTSEKENGQLHSGTATALSKLSNLYASQNNFELAGPHCLRCLRIRRKIFGPVHEDTISSLHDLAYIYSSLGMERNATQLYWEAAIIGDQGAQKTLATRYYKGIGASTHKKLASYWERKSFKNESSDEQFHSRADLTPLHHAIQQGDFDKIRSQITRYKQYATYGDRDGKISIHIAAENGKVEIMKFLLEEFGLDKNIQDKNGQTPLHLAAKNGHITMVKLLITELGADATIMNINRMTSMQLATLNGHFEIMNFIIRETTPKDINLGGINTRAEGAHALAEALKQNTTFTNLNLYRNGIGDESVHALVEALKQNISLTNLNLSYNDIGVEGTQALAEILKQNTTLTNLDLGWNRVGAEGVHALAEALKQNTVLTILNLGNNDIDSEGIYALAEALKQNTALTNLNLSSNEIRVKDVHTLAEALKLNTALTNLILSWNAISAESTHALAEVLKQNTTLTDLNLENNGIGAEGAHALAEALNQNAVLTILSLENNNIGAEGAHALAEALKQNATLATLNLENNKICAEGAHTLAEALKQNAVLRNLNLFYNDIGDEGVYALAEALKQNTALTNLVLSHNNIRAEGAYALAEVLKHNTTLANLDLRSNNIGTGGICALTESLRHRTVFINLDLDHISRLNEDQVFEWNSPFKEVQGKDNHSSIDFKFEAHKDLSESEHTIRDTPIIKLDLEWDNIDIARAVILNQEATSIELDISSQFIATSGARILADFLKYNTTLTNLNLTDNEIGDGVAYALAEALKQNTALINLKLQNNIISAEGAHALAEALKQNTFLTNLDLSYNDISAKGVHALAEALKQNTTLTSLDLGWNRIDAESAHALAEGLKQNTALTTLNLNHNNVDTEGIHALAEALKQNTTLTSLDLSWNDIGDKGAHVLAEALKQNIALTNLNLSWDAIGAEGIHALAEVLKQNTALTNVNLEKNRIGAEGAHALAEALKQNAVLTILNLGCNSIGNKGAYILAEALKQNAALTNLDLSTNSIGSEGAHALAEALKQNIALTNLNLGFNYIGAESVPALAEALKQNIVLTKLYLHYNEIRAEGSHALAEALKQNTALTNLDLSWNEIGAEGTHALAEALKQNTALTNLNLSWNRIGAEGAHVLAKVLKQNTVLTILSLENNGIDDEGAHILAGTLKQNTTLTNLNLSGNNIGAEGAHALADALKQNTVLTNLNLSFNKIYAEGANSLAKAQKQNIALINLNLEYQK